MLRRLVHIIFLSFFFLQAFPQNFSNKGKEFWVGYGYHQAMVGADNSQDMVLYFTADLPATVKVEIPAVGWNKTYRVAANTVIESDAVPKSGSQEARLVDEGLYSTGIHITSDNPIVAYAHIYSSTNSGASLLFPVNTLGQDYYSLNFTQKANTFGSNSWAYVVATEDNTVVEITPSAKTLKHPEGQPFTVTLDKGQVYNIMGVTSDDNSSNNYSGVDLSGTRIRSISTGVEGCKRIAVFSGSGRVSINCENTVTSSDNIIQQVFPQSAWGKKFLTVPTLNLPNNYFRVAVSDPSTVVTIDGVRATSLKNNFYYEITANSPKSIVSDKPVMVAQYITSGNDDATSPCGNSFQNNGDPEMIILSPLEQTIDNVTLNSTSHYQITSHYINVVIKSSAVNSFTIDGASSAATFKPHPGDPAYSFAVFSVQSGAHHLEADLGFNAIAYGYGIKESYGYNAGTNIKNLYQFITVQNPYAVTNTTCSKTPFLLAVTLPYKPTSLVWDFGNNPNLSPSQSTSQNNPIADSSYSIDGRNLYVYKLPGSFTFNTTGTFPVKIIANNQSTDGCSGQQEINYDVQVVNAPKADFSIKHSGCVTDTAKFVDASNGNGNPVVKWRWDFDDGETGNVMNPSKTYRVPGTYNVRLTAINDIGCPADIVKPFTLTPPPVAKFGFSLETCVNNTITFTDSSTAVGGNIVKWNWNFGDGNTVGNTTGAAVTNLYKTEGVYNVSLQVENNEGCRSNVFIKTIEIRSTPVTNFIVPQICVNDPVATFIDSSYVPGGTSGSLAYSWNFGDANATPTNPNISTAQNPQHQFSSPGPYNITLTTTSNAGCSSSVTRSLIVNGIPVTNFRVLDSASLCNNGEVQIQNTSSVSPGSITSVEITWDLDNASGTIVTDSNPGPGKIYSHIYPVSLTPENYSIKMRAFSGSNCFDEKIIAVALEPSPKVTFADVPGMCLNDAAYTIVEARETSGLKGSFLFSGKGVSSEGVFSPSLAGEGSTTIKYTFTSERGCRDSIEQTVTVFPNPTVQLPATVFVLEGESVLLNPLITGSVAQYSWSPAIWLDNANIPNPTCTPDNDTTYRLTVTSPDRCVAFDDIKVALLASLAVPNAFSPNGDGINDVWNIAALQSFQDATVQVFNRYGQIVYSSTGYAKPWDGSYNGSPPAIGTYYYIINVGNGKKSYTGTVAILK